MAFEIINNGSFPKDPSAETIFDSFEKTKNNFTLCVEKVSGKGLSDENFTSTLKSKLENTTSVSSISTSTSSVVLTMDDTSTKSVDLSPIIGGTFVNASLSGTSLVLDKFDNSTPVFVDLSSLTIGDPSSVILGSGMILESKFVGEDANNLSVTTILQVADGVFNSIWDLILYYNGVEIESYNGTLSDIETAITSNSNYVNVEHNYGAAIMQVTDLSFTGGSGNASPSVLSNIKLKSYFEVINKPDILSTTVIDFNDGATCVLDLTQDTSISFANPPANGLAGSITMFINQDATGGWTVSLPPSVSRGTADISTVPNTQTILTFITIDGGTSYTVMTAFKE